jgi:hypothetical protein
MPSSYSPDLRIELIGQGEQDNLWGITTNNNLGSLIEQAICGVTNVVMLNAPTVLIALDGAVDEARSAILNVTSSVPLTASRAIVAPAVPKTYIVANNTTGGQVITIISTSSGTFVNVPVGGTSLVYCDANGNFYEAITATSQLLLNNAITAPTQAATKAYVDAAIGGTSAFPPGTTMLFVQTSAPVGWTQQNAYNDYALRVVAGIGGGTGGTVPFSTAFSTAGVSGTVSSTILNATQIPAHNHGVTDPGHFHTVTVTDPGHTHTDSGHTHTGTTNAVRPSGGGATFYLKSNTTGAVNGTVSVNAGNANITASVTGITAVTASKVTGVTTTNTGGGLGHTHTFTGSTNLNVKYLNTIVCIKN